MTIILLVQSLIYVLETAAMKTNFFIWANNKWRFGSMASIKMQTRSDRGSHSCQLPDFSLRSQTFCYTADFSTTYFLYMPKTMTSLHSITKQPALTLEFHYFYSILQMNFCEPWQKREKRNFFTGTSCGRAGLWPVVTRTLSTSQSFQTFWDTMLATLQ